MPQSTDRDLTPSRSECEREEWCEPRASVCRNCGQPVLNHDENDCARYRDGVLTILVPTNE